MQSITLKSDGLLAAMKVSNVVLNFTKDFQVNRCPRCNEKFVLLAVLDEYGGWLDQKAQFCPYCGEKMR